MLTQGATAKRALTPLAVRVTLILSSSQEEKNKQKTPNGRWLRVDDANDPESFLARYNPRDYDPVAVTVDVAALTIRDAELQVLLVRRGEIGRAHV